MKKGNGMKTFYILSAVFFFGTIISALLVVGSPSQARAERFDRTRVSDLDELSWQILDHYNANQELPDSLDELNLYRDFVDPKNGTPYEYNVQSDTIFELCANFELELTDESGSEKYAVVPRRALSSKYSPYFVDGSQKWYHGVGRDCFIREIKKQVTEENVEILIF